MFESVLLPAPFSPSRACTSPTAASKSTASFATTPGNRFVMPRSRTAGATACVTPAPISVEPCSGAGTAALAGRRALDALDEPADREQVAERGLLAGRDLLRAALVRDRPR